MLREMPTGSTTFFRWGLLALLAALLVMPTIAAATTYVVVDVDGSIDDYAALATILQHPDVSNSLRLITVSSTTWGYGASVVRHVGRFMSLSGHTTVPIALGQTAAMADAYDSTTQRGGCSMSMGFPPTPEAATRRGMVYARSDVTSAFGRVYTLPTDSGAVPLGYSLGDATAQFLNLLRQMSISDTLIYLQLGSATNLASLLSAASNAALTTKIKTVMEVHALEKGYSGGADSRAMASVLASPGLRVILYPPPLYNTSLTFNQERWSRLGTIASATGTAPIVSWVYGAWEAKRARMDVVDTAAFFQEHAPASSLVALCALDSSFQQKCHRYHVGYSSAVLDSAKPSPDAASVVTEASGNNLTSAVYYKVALAEAVDDAKGYIYTKGAGDRLDAASTTLAEDFWTLWLSILSQ